MKRIPLSFVASMFMSALTLVAKPIPEFSSDSCTVHSVVTSPDVITMVLSGQCRLAIINQKMEGGGWNGRAVEALMDRVALRFPRDLYDKVSNEGDPTWEQVCKKALSVEGKVVMLQLASDVITLRQGRVTAITCYFAEFSTHQNK